MRFGWFALVNRQAASRWAPPQKTEAPAASGGRVRPKLNKQAVCVCSPRPCCLGAAATAAVVLLGTGTAFKIPTHRLNNGLLHHAFMGAAAPVAAPCQQRRRFQTSCAAVRDAGRGSSSSPMGTTATTRRHLPAHPSIHLTREPIHTPAPQIQNGHRQHSLRPLWDAPSSGRSSSRLSPLQVLQQHRWQQRTRPRHGAAAAATPAPVLRPIDTNPNTRRALARQQAALD